MTVSQSIELIGGEVAAPSQSESASALDGPATSGTIKLIDDDGYTFTLVFTAALGHATTNVTNAKPGMALLSVPYSLEYSVQNTTANRSAPLSVLQSSGIGGTSPIVVPVWPESSDVCGPNNKTARRSALSFDEANTPMMSQTMLPYCYLTLVSFAGVADDQSELAPNETVRKAFEDTYVVEVPENGAQNLVRAFSKDPTTWLADIPRSASSCDWDWAANDTLVCSSGPTQIG